MASEKDGTSEVLRGALRGVGIGLVLVVAGYGFAFPFMTGVMTVDVPIAQLSSSPIAGLPLDASKDVRSMVAWIDRTGDAGDASYIIIDKKNARLYVFDRGSGFRAMTPILLGGASGDIAIAGVASRPLASIAPADRVTPAGRFVGEMGRNTLGEDVVWVDYDAAISIHRVRLLVPEERRLERLDSPSINDNRISYGCINVPVSFYELEVRPMFDRRRANIYVLPETRPLVEVFPAILGEPAEMAPEAI